MHRHENITATYKLLVDVELWDSWPVRVLLDSLAELRVLEDIEGGKLFGVDALDAEDLDRGARETTLRRLGSSLHEEDHRSRGNGFIDGGSCLVGDEAHLERRQVVGGDLEAGSSGAACGWACAKRSLASYILYMS